MIVPTLALMAVLSATPPPSLGSAASFSILGGSGVTNTGMTRVTGNVGSASGAVTGFPPAEIVPGVGDVVNAGTAPRDVARAWDELATQQCPQKASNTLPATPEASVIYCVSTVADLTQFNAHGHEDAVWIIRITGPLTTVAGSSMQLLEGAQSSHIFWQVSGTATLGERSAFVGSLLTDGDITLGEGVTVSGRLLARRGTVTLVTDDVNLCCDPIAQSALPNGAEKVSYSETIIPDGGTWPYTFSLFAGTDTPPGLKLHEGGTLSGFPEKAGSYTFIVLVKDYKGCTSIHTYTIVICKDVVLDPVALPPGTAGKRYTVDIREGGSRFTLRDLPAWLSPIRLSPIPPTCSTDVQLSGTPSAKGNNTFTVVYCDTQCIVNRTYTINVDCPQITFVPPDLPNGTVGTTYAKPIRADGGTAPYTYNPSNLVTVPTLKPGPYKFHVEATDANHCSGTNDYVVNVECPTIKVFPEWLPTDTVNVQLTAVDLPFRYEFMSSDLPPLATLTTDGLLSWAETPSGDYLFTVTATHKESGCAGSRTYTLHVCPLITIAPTTLSRATLLVPYSKQITIAGGSPPYTVTPTSIGFLTLSPEVTADGIVTIAGTPTMTGVVEFTVIATDANGCIGMQKYHIAVDPPTPPGAVIPSLSEWMLAMLAIVVACVALRRMS